MAVPGERVHSAVVRIFKAVRLVEPAEAGIEAQLDINPGSSWDTDRYVNTRGHSSPYCSGWKSGNIAENTPVALRVCLVKGTNSPICSAGVRGSA